MRVEDGAVTGYTRRGIGNQIDANQMKELCLVEKLRLNVNSTQSSATTANNSTQVLSMRKNLQTELNTEFWCLPERHNLPRVSHQALSHIMWSTHQWTGDECGGITHKFFCLNTCTSHSLSFTWAAIPLQYRSVYASLIPVVSPRVLINHKTLLHY